MPAAPRRRTTRPPKGRPPAAAAAALPQRLLDAAVQVFVAHGYTGATMDAVARAAGVSRKTLYARHANKAELLTAVVNGLLDAALAPQAADTADATVAPDAVLRQLAFELAALSAAPQVAGLNRLILGAAHHAPELARLFHDLHERALDRVSAVLARLQDDGHLALPGDARLAAALFVEMAASLPRLRAMLGRPMTRAQVDAQVDAAVDLFVAGYGGRPARRAAKGKPRSPRRARPRTG